MTITVPMPGMRSTRVRLVDVPAGAPGSAGSSQWTATASTTNNPASRANGTRQPAGPPSEVPAGTPATNATVPPPKTNVAARPVRSGGTRRAA